MLEFSKQFVADTAFISQPHCGLPLDLQQLAGNFNVLLVKLGPNPICRETLVFTQARQP